MDLINQSRNRSAEIVYLVSGDDDLSEAVEEAQYLGVQVIGLVVPNPQGEAIAVSKNLQMTVDQMQLIDPAVIDTHVKRSIAVAIKEVAAASAAKATAEPAQVVVPTVVAVPSPLSVAQAHQRPRPQVAPAAVPVYSTSTGAASGAPADVVPSADIEDVVDKVVINWWRGASQASRDELMSGKPIIPAEMDRALLSDLSNRLAVYDIPQAWRFELRDAFWAKIGRL